jgi:hypothetical protein
MKIILSTLSIFITYVLFAQTNPKISFGYETFDFGDIKILEDYKNDTINLPIKFISKGDTLIAPFYFKNLGTSDLVISDVKPTCGCTITDFTKIVGVGQGSIINLKFVPVSIGPFYKSATVLTNDPDVPSIILRFQGNVIE